MDKKMLIVGFCKYCTYIMLIIDSQTAVFDLHGLVKTHPLLQQVVAQSSQQMQKQELI